MLYKTLVVEAQKESLADKAIGRMEAGKHSMKSAREDRYLILIAH